MIKIDDAINALEEIKKQAVKRDIPLEANYMSITDMFNEVRVVMYIDSENEDKKLNIDISKGITNKRIGGFRKWLIEILKR